MMSTKKYMRSAMEAMMFVWGEPLEVKVAAEMFNITDKEAMEQLEELRKEYEEAGRGLRIRRIEKSYQLVTAPENAEYIRRLCTPVKKRRLSQSAMEVLAIVAYKQPVTRGEIEAVRGIKCDRVLETLATKGLVEEKGRSAGIGRPILYGTTDTFLKQFGFADLKELPKIDDIALAVEMPEEYEDSVMMNQISLDEMGKLHGDLELGVADKSEKLPATTAHSETRKGSNGKNKNQE